MGLAINTIKIVYGGVFYNAWETVRNEANLGLECHFVLVAASSWCLVA